LELFGNSIAILPTTIPKFIVYNEPCWKSSTACYQGGFAFTKVVESNPDN
jgi:hypothetical protein